MNLLYLEELNTPKAKETKSEHPHRKMLLQNSEPSRDRRKNRRRRSQKMKEHAFGLANISPGAFITLLVTILGTKYQHHPVSPFEANPTDMLVFMGSLSLYASGLMAAVMLRNRTRGRRGLAVALLFWHLGFISGLIASASLLFLFVPASFWWILIVSSSLLLLIAAPCKPIHLFYSKIHNRPTEEADENIPDVEKDLHPFSDIHDSNN